MSQHKRAGPWDGHRETSPFPAVQKGEGQPLHKPTLLQHWEYPGWQCWKWSSSCWQPPRATSVTTDPGDKLHLNQAKVKNVPGTQAQLPQATSLPQSWVPHNACPAPSHPQGRASRNSLCNDIFSLPLFPLRYFTQAQKQKGKILPPFRAGTGNIITEQPKLGNKTLGEDDSSVPSAPG